MIFHRGKAEKKKIKKDVFFRQLEKKSNYFEHQKRGKNKIQYEFSSKKIKQGKGFNFDSHRKSKTRTSQISLIGLIFKRRSQTRKKNQLNFWGRWGDQLQVRIYSIHPCFHLHFYHLNIEIGFVMLT